MSMCMWLQVPSKITGVLFCLYLELLALVIWVLRTKLSSSGRAANVLQPWTLSLSGAPFLGTQTYMWKIVLVGQVGMHERLVSVFKLDINMSVWMGWGPEDNCLESHSPLCRFQRSDSSCQACGQALSSGSRLTTLRRWLLWLWMSQRQMMLEVHDWLFICWRSPVLSNRGQNKKERPNWGKM